MSGARSSAASKAAAAPDQLPVPLELDAAGEQLRGVAGDGVRLRLSSNT